MTKPRLTAVLVTYPGMTLIDMIGPLTTWFHAMDVYVVGPTLDDVPSDTVVAIRPTHVYADVPERVDILCVGGGLGQPAAAADPELIGLLRDVGARASWITSVCGGSLLLGVAGLLEGYRATSHWSALKLLPSVGVEPATDRVVVDRNRVTGGGATAGIDFGLTLLARLLGDGEAELAQLLMEYDPEPPFTSGHPRSADPVAVAAATALTDQVNDGMAAVIAARG